MSNIKFTADGKKVSIIGKLNQAEWIVQEVFVTKEGAEIPAGENFVVKSLLDAPAESWKEKSLRELEERYEASKNRLEREREAMERKLSDAIALSKVKANALFAFSRNSDSEQLNILVRFMSGEITHFFDAQGCAILTFDEAVTEHDYHRRSIEGLKLISLFGSSNGDLQYRLHNYSDGSGGSREVIPFTSYAEAFGYAQAAFNDTCKRYVEPNQSYISDSWFKIKELVMPLDAREKYERLKKEANEKRIATLQAEIDKLRQ